MALGHCAAKRWPHIPNPTWVPRPNLAPHFRPTCVPRPNLAPKSNFASQMFGPSWGQEFWVQVGPPHLQLPHRLKHQCPAWCLRLKRGQNLAQNAKLGPHPSWARECWSYSAYSGYSRYSGNSGYSEYSGHSGQLGSIQLLNWFVAKLGPLIVGLRLGPKHLAAHVEAEIQTWV